MPGNVSGLNLYNADAFKAFGEQVIQDSKKILNKHVQQGAPADSSDAADTSASVQAETVPVVPEIVEDENTGLDVTSLSNRAGSAQNSALSNIYDNMQGMRAGLNGDQSDSSELGDVTKYLTDEENNNTNEKMMNLHGKNQKLYGDKYYHGSATSDNSFEWEINDGTKGIYTNNSVDLMYGTKKSATYLNASFELGKEFVPEMEIPAVPESSDDEDINDLTEKAKRRAGTRDVDGSDYPDPEIPTTPQKTEASIQNVRNIDAALLHNRIVNVGKQEYVVGAGVDWHSHDNGDTRQLTFRGGVGHAESGFGVTFDTTSYNVVGPDEKRHTMRDSKVKIVVLNNEIDEHPQAEAQESGITDISELPIVQTRNDVGVEFVCDDGRLGGDLSYVISDVASLKNGIYNRSQIYIKGGYLNETQEVDEPDKHKIKLGAEWNYQHVESDRVQFNSSLSAAYYNTVQSGSSPDYLMGIKGSANATIGPSQISFTGSMVKTNNTDFSQLSLNYRYAKKNWEFGADAGYCNSNVYADGQKSNTKYFNANVNVAYKF